MKFTLATIALIATVSFVGCTETFNEKKADAVRDASQGTASDVRDSSQQRAESIEDRGEAKADAIENRGEAKADQLERMNTPAVREVK